MFAVCRGVISSYRVTQIAAVSQLEGRALTWKYTHSFGKQDILKAHPYPCRTLSLESGFFSSTIPAQHCLAVPEWCPPALQPHSQVSAIVS